MPLTHVSGVAPTLCSLWAWHRQVGWLLEEKPSWKELGIPTGLHGVYLKHKKHSIWRQLLQLERHPNEEQA